MYIFKIEIEPYIEYVIFSRKTNLEQSLFVPWKVFDSLRQGKLPKEKYLTKQDLELNEQYNKDDDDTDSETQDDETNDTDK